LQNARHRLDKSKKTFRGLSYADGDLPSPVDLVMYFIGLWFGRPKKASRNAEGF